MNMRSETAPMMKSVTMKRKRSFSMALLALLGECGEHDVPCDDECEAGDAENQEYRDA